MKLGNKIKKINQVSLENFSVALEFENKKKFIVRLSHLFDKPKGLAAEVLRGNLFVQCFIEQGALAWPNGLELCPDSLYQLALEQKENR